MDNLIDIVFVFNIVCIDKVEVDLNRDQIDLIIKIKRFIEVLDKKVENFIIKGED